MIRAWPGEHLHARAVLGTEVLSLIGTDVALMNLHAIAQKLKFKGLQDKAREKIDRIAEARGLTAAELADRLVPDLDLDPDGSRILDFGTRQFRVGFDEQLRPFVRDAEGARLADLPKPSKSDDAAKANAARETYKALKLDVRTLASGQILRMELAMCDRRRWDASTFRTFLVDHPLVCHVVRRLLWATYTPGGTVDRTFRVAEDRTLADIDDRPFELDGAARVGIPHRLELDAALCQRWGDLWGEYEILPPFTQISREVFQPKREEQKSKEISRVEGVKVPSTKVLSLLARAWRKGPALDNGSIWWFEREIPGADETATLKLSPGLNASAQYTDPEQKLGVVELPVTCRELDPIVFSELVRDIMALTSG
jgi:hypothetical protein